MEEFYQGTYRDQYGEESIIIRNDGKDLWTTIRGIEFTSQNLYEFELVNDKESADTFTLTPINTRHDGKTRTLIDYRMEFEIPITIIVEQAEEIAYIYVVVDRGLPKSELRFRDYVFRNPWAEFEGFYEKLDIPSESYLKACITCAYSDYNPIGNDIFGDMMCFRGNKAAYLKVTTKSEFFDIMPTCTERVQETYLCPEFERRVKGAGYRG